MANELRVRTNFVGGMVEDNPLTAAASTLTSASLAALPVIGSTQHLPLVLDPDGIAGDPEIVYVTAHTVSATTATILRGQENTVGRQHSQDIPWVHAPLASDFVPTLADKYFCYANIGTFTMASRTFTKIPLTVTTPATFDPTSRWSAANNWYVVPIDGLYLVSQSYYFADGAPSGYDYTIGPSTSQTGIDYPLTGWVATSPNSGGTVRNAGSSSGQFRFTAGQTVSLFYYWDNASTQAMNYANMSISLLAKG